MEGYPSSDQDSVVVFGIRISPFALPWITVPAEQHHSTITWRSRSGPVPAQPDEWWREEDESLVVGWGGYAEYRVEVLPRPRAEATVGPISEADAASAFIFSVLPLALPLFGLEPFHGSAVGVQGGALLVLGAAGAGKSSTAAAMEAGGFDLLADDASAIDGEGRLWPGPPALNPRWGDAQQRVVWKYNAKDVRAPERHSTAPQPAVAALILTPEKGAPVQIRPLGRQETFVSLLANVRAPEVLATHRRSLQLRLGAVLSAMPAAAISFDPAQQPFEQIAEVASEWVLRASN
jgi:hypothetical protein